MGVLTGEETENRTVSGNFKISLALTQQRILEVSGFIYSDDQSADVHRRVDMMQDVLDRQFARTDIITKKAQVESELGNLENLRRQYEGMAVSKAEGRKLSSTEKNQLANTDTNLQVCKHRIESLQAAIKAAEAMVALPD